MYYVGLRNNHPYRFIIPRYHIIAESSIEKVFYTVYNRQLKNIYILVYQKYDDGCPYKSFIYS